jgi:hypothetical protein
MVDAIKNRRLKWTEHTQHAWTKQKILTKFWLGNIKARDHLEYLSYKETSF